MNFLELSHLNRDQATHLTELQETLRKHHHSSPNIYWHILKKMRPVPCNILAYSGRELIGFCSRFLFHMGSTEICLMVHPKFQTEFFIKSLVYQVIKYIPAEHKNFMIVSTPHEQKPLICPNGNWEFLYSSYRLQWQGAAKKPDSRPGFNLNKAKVEDYQGFKILSEIGFPNGTDLNPEIFKHIIENNTTQLWLLKKDELIVGSIQINQENRAYRISDITVLPEFRQQGLGHFLLKSMVHLLHQRQKNIILDVESTNPVALEWYLGLNMRKINTTDYWRLPFNELGI